MKDYLHVRRWRGKDINAEISELSECWMRWRFYEMQFYGRINKKRYHGRLLYSHKSGDRNSNRYNNTHRIQNKSHCLNPAHLGCIWVSLACEGTTRCRWDTNVCQWSMFNVVQSYAISGEWRTGERDRQRKFRDRRWRVGDLSKDSDRNNGDTNMNGRLTWCIKWMEHEVIRIGDNIHFVDDAEFRWRIVNMCKMNGARIEGWDRRWYSWCRWRRYSMRDGWHEGMATGKKKYKDKNKWVKWIS